MYFAEVFPGDGLPTVMCQSSHQGPRFNLLWVPLWNSKTSDISVHQAPFVVRCILVLVSYATRFTFSSHLGANVLSLLGHLHIVACGQFVLNRMERALCPLPAGCPCEWGSLVLRMQHCLPAAVRKMGDTWEGVVIGTGPPGEFWEAHGVWCFFFPW